MFATRERESLLSRTHHNKSNRRQQWRLLLRKYMKMRKLFSENLLVNRFHEERLTGKFWEKNFVIFIHFYDNHHEDDCWLATIILMLKHFSLADLAENLPIVRIHQMRTMGKFSGKSALEKYSNMRMIVVNHNNHPHVIVIKIYEDD